MKTMFFGWYFVKPNITSCDVLDGVEGTDAYDEQVAPQTTGGKEGKSDGSRPLTITTVTRDTNGDDLNADWINERNG